MKKIAVVGKMIGLDKDDRIRKECSSLAVIANVKLFALLENNSVDEGITSYGIPYIVYSLKTRKLLPHGKFLLTKAIEFYLKVKHDIKNYDLLWINEEYCFMFALFGRRNSFIWDLHEIPSLFTKWYMKPIFHYIEKKSYKIVHANDQRIKYLNNINLIKRPSKHFYLRNFPDETFLNSNIQSNKFLVFKEWLHGEMYVYLQGIGTEERYPYNSISSILDSTNFKIVVVGAFLDDIKKILESKYEDLYDRVFFTGVINSLTIIQFMRGSVFSMVFYNIDDPNCRYCEANRFYQSICEGIPCIVGKNETMSEIINIYNNGVVCASDGRDKKSIEDAIHELISNYDLYKKNAEYNKKTFLWNEKDVISLI